MGMDITTLSHHPYILCHSNCQLCTQNSLHARILFIRTKRTRYSTLLTPRFFHQSISTIFSSNKISQHNLNRPYTIHTIQTQHALLMDSMHSFCIQARQTVSAMLSIASTLYIAATHNITQSSCTSTCTPSTTHHTAFTTLYTQLREMQSIFVVAAAKWHKM